MCFSLLRIIRIGLEQQNYQVNYYADAENSSCKQIYYSQKHSALIKFMYSHYAKEQAQEE